MRWTPKMLSCLLASASFATLPQNIKAEEESQPQMVWVNYAEGEVRFSPGHKGKPQLGKNWIEANVGQVMEDGYTLVTEKGRAEIEFEDGSVIYLAEHSALEFNALAASGEATTTELSLLTGTATVAHASDNFIYLSTPAADTLRIKAKQTITVESTLDGIVVGAVENLTVEAPTGRVVTLKAGESVGHVNGLELPVPAGGRTAEEKDWDAWVIGRWARRRALVEQGMKEAGLAAPIPGLAGMVEGGRFFDCAPYGKCWEPYAATSPEMLAQRGTKNGTVPQILVNRTMLARCPMEAWRVAAGRQRRTPVRSQAVQYGPCLAGSWNYSQTEPCPYPDGLQISVMDWDMCNVYANPMWVAGGRHRHECHWVKVGHHRVGIIPRHPLDRRGQPPVNRRILTLAAEKGKLQAGVRAVSSGGVHALGTEPKRAELGLEKGLVANAPRVAQPVIEARMASGIASHEALSAEAGHTDATKSASAIRFDYKTGSFVGKTSEGASGRGVVVAHVGSGGFVGGHGGSGGTGSGGGHIVSGGGGGNAHGSSGGSGSGGSHGGSSGGSSGGGGGGGGGHSGGGSSGGSSAGSSAGGGASAGGGHH